MITWLATKTFLKKSWAWLKHNWKAPAVVLYTIVLWILFRRRDDAKKILEIRKESYEKQIEAINEAYKNEIEKRDDILKKYKETMEQLESEFKKRNENLDEKKKEAVKKMVEKYHDDPNLLAKMISEQFGIDYSEGE